METVPLLNGERSVQASQLDRIEDRVVDRGGGFMLSARSVISLQPRIVSSKRKLEDLEVDSSDLVGVRPRWEVGHDCWQERRQTMVLGDQFGNCEIESRTMEVNCACVMNCVVEESNFDNSVLQGSCEAEVAIHSDSLDVGNEIMMMEADFSEVEYLRTASTDVHKISSSTTKDDTMELLTDEEEGEILMECSTQGNQSIDYTFDYPTSASSTSIDKIEDSMQTVSDVLENVSQLVDNEEHKEQCADTREFEYDGKYIDMPVKEKENDEDMENSLSKCLTETLEVSNAGHTEGLYAGTSSCSSSQGCFDLNESTNNGSSVKEMDSDVSSSELKLQFFVRTILDGRTIVLHASLSDTVDSIHRMIQSRTGLPSYEQRLIYCGKQLQQDQTLADYNVTKDAMLHLVGRMRSTALPLSWRLVNDLVSIIWLLCGKNDKPNVLQDMVRDRVKDFLKMAAKPVPPSDHMQVFQLAGATQALVMLLLSPLESNSKCAEECIKLFTSSSDEYLPNRIHCYCAPILLDFCKLLANKAPNNGLYPICRSSLAALLDTIGAAHGSPYFNEARASTIVQEFSPFVNELSNRLSSSLRWTKNAFALQDIAVNNLVPLKEGQDFTAFVIPLCKAMESCKGSEGHMPSYGFHMREKKKGIRKDLSQKLVITASYSVNLKEEIGSHRWLQAVFRTLLLEIDSCLEAVEDVLVAPGTSTVEDHPFGWTPFLVVLKGLHAIAKLYDEAMEEMLSILKSRHTALNILVRQSRWNDDHFWLLDYGFLLDFESKKRLVMAMLPEPQDDHDERQEVVVHRSQLLTDSFESLAYVEPEILQGGISVEFLTEEATGPGVLREWFCLICREIFNPQNALFLSCPNDRRRFFPNPASGVNPGHLTYFKFCGRVIALALMHRVQIDVVLARAFFRQLAGESVCWEDIRDADPELYMSCKKILELDPEIFDSGALELTFVTEVEELGSRKIVELCPGGKDKAVSSINRHQYVDLLIQRRFVTSVTEQVNCFAQGFQDLLVNSTYQQFLRALEPEDVDLMLYGYDRDICLNDWKAHTEYHEYNEDDDTMTWFWQVVEDMKMEERRKLLFFSTSLAHLPAEGFSGLSSKFHIHRAYTDLSWLPTAHTCFYQLVIPPYSCFKMMYDRLHAITEGDIAEGFGFP
ncbi:E3 ubiquitin-protein ligase UPL5 [Cryptomeria japonica]|uniref:E3 ubiquitin-protein ligase UPL5 n=1 Tax=Cryptomeria japonica TaxID=3369 RepID=UPI0027DA2534|nr:E3 ubiquitin-protein ligase UPL5 [Cryptomeria japonica]